jgi:acyl-CoA synthetase (AMP-forming)/AMP-acid ligase II
MPDVPLVLHEALTLPELLRARAARRPDDAFVRLGDARLTYGEFDARTDALAAGLAALGICPGDVIAVCLPNRLELLEVWWAILKVGAVFNPVNPAFASAEVAMIMGDSGAVVAVCDAGTVPLVVAERERLPALRDIVTVDDCAHVRLSELRSAAGTTPSPRTRPSDLAALVYTSGTTGRPKGAMLSHHNYLSNAWMLAEVLPVRRGDTLGMILPLFHVNAQVVTTVLPMLLGANVATWERFSASTFWDTVAVYRPVSFSSVPTILAALLHAPGADAADTSSLEYVLCGAAPMAASLFQRFEAKFGLKILEGYGLTEGTCGSTVNPFYGPRKVGSIGLPVRGQGLQIRREDGSLAATGEAGELFLRGPNVMAGYYGLPQETAETLVGGWLRTGDVGYQDADGYVYLVDRAKDMIIRGGENIYPREIEDILSAHAAVREVAVIGRADPVRGEEVHAVVVLLDGASASEDELVDHCRLTLAAFKLPTSIEFRAELPKTSTGKIDKKPLRATVAASAAD